jgi:hypothetical protein
MWLGFLPGVLILYHLYGGLRVDSQKMQGLFCKSEKHESPMTSCGHHLRARRPKVLKCSFSIEI